MKCLECGKDYRLLGNHVWQAHGIKCRDYKVKHNIPITQPLADDSWVEMMKDIGNEMKETPAGKALMDRLKRCAVKNNLARSLRMVPSAKMDSWPEVSKVKASIASAISKKAAVETQFHKAKEEWAAGVPIKEMVVSEQIIYRWIAEGRLPKRKRKVFHKLPND